MKKQISYRNQLFFLLVFFGVFISIVISVIIYYLLLESYHKEIKKNASLEVVMRKRYFNSTLTHNKDTLRFIARHFDNDISSSFSNTSPNSILIKDVIESNKNILKIRFIDISGRELISIKRSENSQKTIFTDPSEFNNISSNFNFKEIMKLAPDTILISKFDSEELELTTLLYDSKKPVGIITISLNMKNLLSNIINSAFFNVILLDAQGVVLAHSDTNADLNIEPTYMTQNILKQTPNYDRKNSIYSEFFFKEQKEEEGLVILLGAKSDIDKYARKIFAYVLLFNILIIPIHFLIALLISKAYYKLLSYHKRHEAIMIQQSKMAAIGEMISFIAHQWRQPLNRLASILMRTRVEIKQETFNRETLTKSLDEQEEMLEHLSETIESFRNFYKPNKSFSTFSPNSAIEQVLELFSSTLKESGITYKYKKCSETVIEGHKNEFMHVILTVINNATYILDERGVPNPYINITALIKENNVYITIEDNGGGIKVKPIKKIFEPYFSKNKNKKSSGMGLYISKLIIEDHFNGTLQVQNIVDGSQFIIVIPTRHLEDTLLS